MPFAASVRFKIDDNAMMLAATPCLADRSQAVAEMQLLTASSAGNCFVSNGKSLIASIRCALRAPLLKPLEPRQAA
jgi:hypothetical protein